MAALETVRDLYQKGRKIKDAVMNVPEIERKVRECTSNNAWGASGTMLAEVAQASRSQADYAIIISTIWKRLNDSGKNWRHVYKGLSLLEYLIIHGNPRVVDDIRERLYQIRTLADFHHIDEDGQDRGLNVREKSKKLCELVQDDKRIDEEREKGNKNKDRYVGISSNSGASGRFGNSGSGGGGGGGYDDYKPSSKTGSRYDDEYERKPGSYASRTRDGDKRNDSRNSDDVDKDDDDERPAARATIASKPAAAPAAKAPAKVAVPEKNLLDLDDPVPAPAPAHNANAAALDFFGTPAAAPSAASFGFGAAAASSFPAQFPTNQQSPFGGSAPAPAPQTNPFGASAFGAPAAAQASSPWGAQPFGAAPQQQPQQQQMGMAQNQQFGGGMQGFGMQSQPQGGQAAQAQATGGQGWGDFAVFQQAPSANSDVSKTEPASSTAEPTKKDPWAMGSSLVDLNKLTISTPAQPQQQQKPTTGSMVGGQMPKPMGTMTSAGRSPGMSGMQMGVGMQPQPFAGGMGLGQSYGQQQGMMGSFPQQQQQQGMMGGYPQQGFQQQQPMGGGFPNPMNSFGRGQPQMQPQQQQQQFYQQGGMGSFPQRQ
mmetsp:Transcript_19927/g.32697  ORF Transcript_19927/g.32697 Transcript_19927/m.32697 type:complete len:597 (-) Transcript_19927:552-2342(-)|eukprot:CAMPEP_0184663770 /NCGR_PEP_ID=MMETSP0308-20130426/49704_1 /TAXON_ID=38269 /ORGANISM="Gloeochaete witrockiana, Strain SAG 46.84" /LENGTH=596 /DNA_ID=CAMNT_0027106745 /DNA_START=75 /DNA_END=1865 /DNA_ORIENTATION=+